MKATELRMGDWVLVDGEPMKIAETDLTYFSAWKKDGTFCGKIGYEAAEPIALTEDMLEKSGWTYSEAYNDWRMNSDDFKLFTNVQCWDVRSRGSIYDLRSIKYVHELQHLLWALGVEKEVEV